MAMGGMRELYETSDPEMTHDLSTSEHIECTNLQCQLDKPA